MYGVCLLYTSFQAKIMLTIAQKALVKIREDLFTKMQRLPIRFYDTNNNGDLMSRFTNDVDTVGQMLSSTLVQLLSLIHILGFYKSFLPLVQSYSCAESPFWLAKAFMCLHLPEDHPFWTAKEENGVWDEMRAGETRETVLNGPGPVSYTHLDVYKRQV